MDVWNVYSDRITSVGSTKRQAMLRREKLMLARKLMDSLSYHIVLIDDVERNVAIIDSDNLNEKYMYSLPDENFDCGGLVEWTEQGETNRWLINEKDSNNEVYTRVKLLQCNHLLKWVDDDDVIHEQWCAIEDGTKYLTGEETNRDFVITRGDARIAMTIARNENTVKFGREHRFLIDDPDSGDKMSFLLTKPLKVGKTYNNKGVFSFVLQEVVSTDYDNMELGIADYYKHFPREEEEIVQPPKRKEDESETQSSSGTASGSTGKKVWL